MQWCLRRIIMKNLLNFLSAWQGNYLWQSMPQKFQRLVVSGTGRFFFRSLSVMDPRLFVFAKIMAELVIEFATRQGNSYVSVVGTYGDWKAKRFASFLSRKFPTCLITQHGMDKQRLPMSQVQMVGFNCRILHKKFLWISLQLFFYDPTMSDCTTLQYEDLRSQDTWLIPYSCLPLPPAIKLGVDSNVYSYSGEANGSVTIHELYKVPLTQVN